jgi:central kinetochore subunit Mal2/MCM21
VKLAIQPTSRRRIPTTTPKTQASAATVKAVEKQSLEVLASSARTSAGITAFRVQDPDPHALNGGEILGVRIDMFSTRQSKFLPPYFLLFRQLDAATLKLYKHTIPACISLRPLLAKHMSVPAEGDVASSDSQDLPQFVRAVRRELGHLVNTTDAVDGLRESVEGGEGKPYEIDEVKWCGPRAVEVTLKLQSNDTAMIRIGSSQTIEKARVCILPSHEIGTRKRIERAMMQNDGQLDGLGTRLDAVLKQLKLV